VFNATFSYIMTTSFSGGENHRPWASNWQFISLAAASRVHFFCNLKSWARTHTVLVIGLYELLVPTTYLIVPPGPILTGRQQLVTENGDLCYNISYPKAKKGTEAMVKPQKGPPTYGKFSIF
jgi:hypothetical protein